MQTDVVVHVGYGKTATTWLQEKIFNTLGESIYLGKRESSFPEWLLKINYLDEFAYYQQREMLKEKISGILSGKERVVISSEAFTNFGVIYQQIGRIEYFFEKPRIILVLRHPINWLLSNYKYCVEHEGFCRPLEAYLDFSERRTPFSLEKRPPFYLPDFFYDEVVGRYCQVFGSDNVFVLRYEDFVTDPGSFGDRLSAFIGIAFPAFKEKAGQKVLVSKQEQEVEVYRLKNMTKFLHDSEVETLQLVSTRSQEELLSTTARERLRQLFSPHCVQFYPELDTQ